MTDAATRTTNILEVERLVNKLLSEHKETYEVWLSQRFDQHDGNIAKKTISTKAMEKKGRHRVSASG